MMGRRYSSLTTVVRFVAVGLWVAVIWGHSLMAGAASSKESMAVVAILQKVSEYFGDTDYSFLRRLMLHFGITEFSRLEYFVRKAAHFTEHAILGILMARALRTQLRSPLLCLLFSAVLSGAVPFVDELVIQTHVAGRVGSLSDVYLDLKGVACGLVLSLPGTLLASSREPRG